MDASVLIDLVKADRGVLKLIVQYVGPLFVVDAVVGEVNQIDNEDELIKFGVSVFEPPLEDVEEALKMTGPTSFQDHLCYLTAKRNGFVCVTNDRNLRKLCTENGVAICWGLELLIKLYQAGGIILLRAQELGELIHQNNPRHITIELVNRFKQALMQANGDSHGH